MTAIRVRDVSTSATTHEYRSPMKFGGVAVTQATVQDVTVTVEDAAGRRATGFGSMPLGNVWAYPAKDRPYSRTLAEMVALVEVYAKLTAACPVTGHPIDIGVALEHECLARRGDVPELAALVCLSPFDAAVHDAFGKLLGLSCYRTYGADFLPGDLSRHLGPEFAGVRLSDALTETPQATMPMYHLVGALDPLTAAEVSSPIADGLPESLDEWIRRDGLRFLKIKLSGDDTEWDLARVRAVDAVAEPGSSYSLDFNERCPSVRHLGDFLDRLGEPLSRVRYVEQPTARDLSRADSVAAASARAPVVIDESLTGLESLRRARGLGYTGAALKACKGQTQSLLLAAAARHWGMFLCVQDLTCPGASLIHSAGLAAHVRGVSAIESNGRQYLPAANAGWDARFPGVFTIRGGVMATGRLTRPGLGAA